MKNVLIKMLGAAVILGSLIFLFVWVLGLSVDNYWHLREFGDYTGIFAVHSAVSVVCILVLRFIYGLKWVISVPPPYAMSAFAVVFGFVT